MTYLTRQKLDADTLIISDELGFEPETVELLLKAKIRTIGELLDLEEYAVCAMLVEDDLGFGMSNELAVRAHERFMRLRHRLDVLGHGFAGPRHDPAILWAFAL